MIGVRKVWLPLTDTTEEGGGVWISLLPQAVVDAKPPPLVDLRGQHQPEVGVLAAVQVLEGHEYRFVLEVPDEFGWLKTDRPELFQPDAEDGRAGRFRPGLHTGTVPVKVFGARGLVGAFEVEVRSRKLDYLKHYRWMLRDLAEGLAEIVMERFAASEQRFRMDDERDARTLYQRFALLQSLLQDDHLMGAIHQVIARPYVTWENEEEIRPISQGVRGSSQVVRQIARHGARVPWSGGARHVATLPRQVLSRKTYSTIDNGPNRFIKFALMQWRDVVAQVHDVLARDVKSNSPILRGIRESAALRDRLDALLSEEFFREIGPLYYLPANSQVLQKRTGYRTVYQTYIQLELASKLSWEADDVFGAGQRNVATLYEYWVFLQVVAIVAKLCDVEFDPGALFQVNENGLSVGLRQGTWKVVEGTTTSKSGQRIKLALHFNKTFRQGVGSWTRTMRPDTSLYIGPADKSESYRNVWIHFDAKYRVDALQELLGGNAESEDAEDRQVEDGLWGRAKGEDLLKMHAYRDAIRRSAAAYVLYPGTDTWSRQEFHEILPGLGAFPFYPTETGVAGGGHALQTFISEIVDHLASEVTQHERGRYWRDQAYGADGLQVGVDLPAAPFLTRPAADTLVLLGYVKDAAHLAWIHEQGLYNLRADAQRRGSVGLGARELAADLVVLYGPELERGEVWQTWEEPRILNREGMVALGYPAPRGEHYFGLGIRRVSCEGHWGAVFRYEVLKELQERVGNGRAYGAPVAVSWLRLVEAVGRGI